MNPAAAPPAPCGLWQSRGRRHVEAPHPYRSDFQRDRDRIFHARAFRRLENKTQVFSRRFSDHFRTRLTHTLEVAQISRTVAAAVGLNTDLVETLALAHDLGHPPFGHTGEQALDALMRGFGDGFDHNLQALRIVEQFEVRYASFPGLNLTFEVREGLVKHSHDYTVGEHPELEEYLLDLRPPLEAQIIDLTDEIAYSTADLDDGSEAGLLSQQQIAEVGVVGRLFDVVDEQYGSIPAKLRFNEMLRRLLDHFATDLIQNLAAQLPCFASVEAIRSHPQRVAAFSPAVEAERQDLKRFLYRNMYHHTQLAEEHEEAADMVTRVFQQLYEHPEKLPAVYRHAAAEGRRERVICDYIAGMTDTYIRRLDRNPSSRAGR